MKDKVLGRLMLIPVIIFILFFVFYVVYQVFENSLFSQHMFSESRTFVGIQNYIDLFKSEDFWNSMKNSFIYTIGVVTLQLIVGLTIALIINSTFPGRNIVRSMVLFSYLVPMVIVSIIFRFMLTGDNAIINYFLQGILHLNTPSAWLSNPRTAMLAVIIIGCWKNVPFMVIVFLAQLQSMNMELYEAARIDGANKIGEFFYITLPFLKPVIFMALIFRTIWEFRSFELIFLLTGGGPLDRTEVLPIFIYRSTFSDLSLGKGSTTAVIVFIISIAIAIVYIRLYERARKGLR